MLGSPFMSNSASIKTDFPYAMLMSRPRRLDSLPDTTAFTRTVSWISLNSGTKAPKSESAICALSTGMFTLNFSARV
ncbi:MAG: hypothetical protein BWY67_02188 [Bacteroidetes bacterium ADurb.Bin397]|nr:MAG: hypothetical protein BWY67_02188 [Bacteroidetes bacterium ADurb.Bin397]